MAKASKTMLNSSGESGHSCLIPDFRGNALNFLPLRITFAMVLSYLTFIMLSCVPSMPAFWSVFYHKCMLNFVKGFLCIYGDNHMVFIFQFVNAIYHIDWFANIEESLHPWDKPTWSWCLTFWICCWILFARICWRFFICVHQWYWPVVFLCVCGIFVWFGD